MRWERGIYRVERADGVELAGRVEYAPGPWFRVKGLLGRDGLGEGAGIVLHPCNSVHMFFMRFAIDVVFHDRAGVVLKVYDSLRPWECTRVVWGAAGAVEVGAGVCGRAGLKAGDRLVFQRV